MGCVKDFHEVKIQQPLKELDFLNPPPPKEKKFIKYSHPVKAKNINCLHTQDNFSETVLTNNQSNKIRLSHIVFKVIKCCSK